jgi:hypothetical protein
MSAYVGTMCIVAASRPAAVLGAVDLDQRRPHSNVRLGWDMRIPLVSPVLLATEYLNTGIAGNRRGRRVEYSATPAVPCEPCV